MIERVGDKSPKGSEDKKTSLPDSRFFKELMVQKAGEVELEKRKKRPLPKEEETEETEEESTPTPYDTTYYTPPSEQGETITDDLPSSSEFLDKVNSPPKPSHEKTKKEKMKHGEKEKKPSVGIEGLSHPKETKEKPLPGTKNLKEKKVINKEQAKASLLSISAEKEKQPLSPKERTHLKKGEKEVFPPPKEKEQAPIQWPSQLPTHIESTSNIITSNAQTYLKTSADLSLLFHQMVGTIILMQSKNVSVTEVILNSPKFESSDLFGSSIIIEKYSTAPDSYNIKLVGNPRAVAIFDENIQSLQLAFKNSDLDFSVNMLSTEYKREKFLFHRKEGVGKDKKDNKR